MRGRKRSSANFVRPATFAAASIFGYGRPMTWVRLGFIAKPPCHSEEQSDEESALLVSGSGHKRDAGVDDDSYRLDLDREPEQIPRFARDDIEDDIEVCRARGDATTKEGDSRLHHRQKTALVCLHPVKALAARSDLFAAHPRGRQLHCLEDLDVARTAAEIPGERLFDLPEIRPRIPG